MQVRTFDVVVIGAGFSGLAAARTLRAAGASVRVLEARDRCGGRTLTREVAGAKVDMGAQWIGPGQPEVNRLAALFGFTVQPRPAGGADTYYAAASDGEAPARVVESLPFDFAEAAGVLLELDSLAATIDPAAPMAATNARELDSQTVASWCARHLSPSATALVHRIVEGFIGLPEQVSFLHTLFYARANGGFVSLLGMAGVPHDNEVITAGLGSLAQHLGTELGDCVRTGSRVASVSEIDGCVNVDTQAGERCIAGAVVFAAPPALAAAVMFAPELTTQRLSLQRRYLPFSRLKFQVVYARPFWREQGRSGHASGGGFFTFDGSVDERRGIITGFFGPREALQVWHLPQKERARRVIERLTLLFGDQAREPLGYDDMYWLDEPFSHGCVAAPGPGVWTNFGAALRERHRQVVWAGTETALTMPGQVEGAIVSGMHAAREALQLLGE